MLKGSILLFAIVVSSCAFAGDSNCFANSAAYMQAKYGDAYRHDENIVIKKVRYGTQIFYSASDTTSGTNSPRTLLIQMPGKGLCKVLDTPPIATLQALKYDKQGRPIAFISREQGNPSLEITYVWARASRKFAPTTCNEITWVNDNAVSESVPCNDWVE